MYVQAERKNTITKRIWIEISKNSLQKTLLSNYVKTDVLKHYIKAS